MKSLDTLDKLSRIIFGAVGTAVLAYAGLTVQWDQLGLDEDRFCVDFADTAEAALLRRTEGIPSLVVDRYAERCDLDPQLAAGVVAETAALLRAVPEASLIILPEPIWLQEESAAPVAGDEQMLIENGDERAGDGGTDAAETPEPDGFVAIGRADPAAFSDVNFDVSGTEDAAVTDETVASDGQTLVARWSVNLRQNTERTTSGANPSIGLVEAGACVELLSDPSLLRGQYWAPVTLVSCP